MPLFQTQVTLRTSDLLPENFVTNTWWISVRNDSIGEPTQAELVDGINGHLVDFYESLVSFMSPTLLGIGNEIKWYAQEDPPPRVPKYIHVWDYVGEATADQMPREVALVSSYQASPEAGVPQARRRNRIFLGPLSTAGLDGNTGRPNAGIISALTSAAEQFALVSDGANGWSWRVYSGTTGEDHPIANGWVDNSWDTQRRRGEDASSRTVWVQQSE